MRTRAERSRHRPAVRAALDAGKTIVGLEPSCTLMFRDEAVNLIPEWSEEHGAQILTFAEYVMKNPLGGLDMSGVEVLVHGHCHQKAMGVAQHTVDAVNTVLGANAQMIDSSCCGMAGSFGYQAETAEVSRQMAELSLAPTVRAAPKDTVVLADGFSCRCQIKDVTERKAMNLALLTWGVCMSAIFGFLPWLFLQLIMMSVAGCSGVWLFYVQHQFEDAYWEETKNWDFTTAAMEGSSYYKLPKILQWFSGNIGFHHIHHLNPMIPNYNLEKCHHSDPFFRNAPELNIRTSLWSIKYRLWDEENGKMISFRDLKNQLSSEELKAA
ncbi:MAG: hypothetical protein EBY48_07640 [Opitutae bacterium]|nr:hypothetical protein [Opitutae bacterium]